MAFNIQRRTSDIANVVVADASRNVTLPADLTVTNLFNAGILKGNASGKLVAAVAGTDFQSPISLTTTGSSGAATFLSGTLNIPNYTLAGLGGFANPMTTLGDIIYGGASGAATRLGGNTTTAKQYLSQTGNGTASAAPVWATIAGADITGAALTKTDDTNVTLTLGGTPATALLRAASIAVGWTGTLATGRGGTGLSSYVLGDIIYASAANTLAALAGNTVAGKRFLTQTGTGTASAAPSWGQIAASDVTSGAALTKTDDTNVTITLGGTPASALLTAASLTLGWTGTLAVGRGGSGASTLTGVLIGNGTSAFTAITGTAGQLLRRNAGDTAYEFFTPTYLTANQNITLSGDVSGSGATSITTTLATITQSTGSSFVKITLDTKGRVTGNTAVAASDLHSTYGSQTANTFYAAPNGTAGNPSFRAIVAADIPALAYVTSVALATGTTGTDINISGSPITSSGTITLNIPTASATNRGALSAADWTTFNNKQNALTNPVTGTGASGQVAYFNGTTTITSESALFWDATNDRLGIGTTSPAVKLEVAGTGTQQIRITSTSGADMRINADTVGRSGTYSNSDYILVTNSTERARIDSFGNLGLGVTPSAWGTNYPAYQSKTASFMGDGVGAYFSSNWYFDTGNKYIGNGFATSYQQYNGQHVWFTAANNTGGAGAAISFTQAMTLTSDGFLLINSTSNDASNRLQVNGNIRASNIIGVGNATSFSGSFTNDSDASKSVSINADPGNSAASSYIRFNVDGSEYARITSGGNLLVGTTTESGEKLVVSGSSKLDGSVAIYGSSLTAASADWGIYQSVSTAKNYFSGNVGIGTTSPTAKLHIGESGAAAQLWLQRTDGYNPVKLIGGTLADGNGFKITMNTTDAFAITSGGNVGIGTTSPGAIFDVSGGLSNNRSIIRVTNSDTANYVTIGAGIPGVTNAGMNFAVDGTSRMVISSTGNVGIGVTNPSEKLQVEGNVHISVLGSAIYFDTLGSTQNIKMSAQNSFDFHIANSRGNGAKFVLGNTSISLGDTSTEMFYINTSNGRVGIGVTNPVAKLQTSGAVQTSLPTLGSSTGAGLYITNTDTAYGMMFGNSPDGTGWIQQQRTDAGTNTYPISLQPSGGNVLIGTISDAGYKLDVAGSGRFNSGLIVTGVGTQASPAILRVHGSDFNTAGDAKVIIGQTVSNTDLQIFVTGTDTRTDGLTANDQYILSGQRLNLMSIGNGSAYNTSITIGESTTYAYGNIAFGTNTQNSAAITRMLINAIGNVGIGTTSPAERLTVANTGESIIRVQDLDGTNQFLHLAHNGGDSYFLTRNGTANGNFMWYTSDGTTTSERMRITSGGNLLVGTTTDNGNKLQVNGNISASNLAGTTYTPTFTNVSNCSNFTFISASYIRVGNIVTVMVGLEMNAVATNTDSSFKFTLPINATTTTQNIVGNGSYMGNLASGNFDKSLYAQVTSASEATVYFYPNTTNTAKVSISLQYKLN